MRRLILSCAVLLTAVSASAQTTLIYDNFTKESSPSSSYNLAGTTPDTDTFGGTWVQNSGDTAGSGVAQNGILTITSSGNNDNEIYFLQFSNTGLAANTTYTVTMQLGPVSAADSGNEQANFGLASGSSTSINRGNSYFGQVQGGSTSAFTPPGFSGHGGPAASTTGLTSMSFTFDTGTDLVKFYANGSSTAFETYTYGTGGGGEPSLSSIDYLYVDYYSNKTGVSSSANFGPITLTEAADAPEPSTTALLVGGSVAALAFAWRRRLPV